MDEDHFKTAQALALTHRHPCCLARKEGPHHHWCPNHVEPEKKDEGCPTHGLSLMVDP